MSRNDLEIYRSQGFGGTVGIGRKPALCIVDFVNGFVDPAIFGGGNIAESIARTIPLLAAARRRGLPCRVLARGLQGGGPGRLRLRA
jgi:maleamate amidohydrolase